MTAAAELTVGVLAYPGCFASEVFGVSDLLTIGTHVTQAHQQTSAFRTVLISPRRRVAASGDVLIGAQPVQPVDVLVVPGFALVPGEDIRTRLSRGHRLGRHHDSGVQCRARLRPRPHRATARRDRRAPHRPRRPARRRPDQPGAHVDEKLLPPAGSSFARNVQRHLERELDLPYDLSRLAEHFHVSSRTLLRHYRAETGEAPLAHLQRARVRHAQHLLATTTRALGDIQRTVGYGDSGAFTPLFHR